MSEGTAFLLLKGWLTFAMLAFAINELRILRRDERAARAKSAAIVPIPTAPHTAAEPAAEPERRAA